MINLIIDPRPVLVVARPGDVAADLVIGELARRDVRVLRFDAADFPRELTLSARIDPARGLQGMLANGSWWAELSQVRSVYFRCPRDFTFPGLDEQDAGFAALQARYGLGGVIAALPYCLYVNHPHAIVDAGFIPIQLAIAVDLGFTVPPTLITNDPAEARDFALEYGPVVYKPLGTPEDHENEGPGASWVTEVRPAELNGSVAGTAHLFQARVEKVADLQVTVIGERVFCVRIESAGLLDWRRTHDELACTVTDPPPGVAELASAFLRRFGLVSGCFDFALRPDGEAVFLGCDPNGRWTWLEHRIGLPMASALAGLLEQGLP